MSLIYLVKEAILLSPESEKFATILAPMSSSNGTTALNMSLTDEEELFEPNLLKQYSLYSSMAIQISNFAINYRGHP